MSKNIVIKRRGATSYIYFQNYKYHPNMKIIESFIRDAIYRNRCSYGSTQQISHGEISLNFNPVQHNRKDRRKLEKELKSHVKNS